MNISRAAHRYAKAILDFAKESNVTGLVSKDMQTVLQSINENAELAEFLKSPVVSEVSKYNALIEIFTDIQDQTKKVFSLLLENRRFSILDEVAVTYIDLCDCSDGIEVAHVTTAEEISDDLQESILKKIQELTKSEFRLVTSVDKNLLGGFIIRIGDLQYNASLANKLSQLKRIFTN